MPRRVLQSLAQTEVIGLAVLDRQLAVSFISASMRQWAPDVGLFEGKPTVGGARAVLQGLVRGVFETGTPVLRHLMQHPARTLHLDVLPLKDENGTVQTVCVLAHDQTALLAAQAAVQERARLAELISYVSASFIDLPSHAVDQGIERALQLMGEGLALDRAHVGMFGAGFTTFHLTHQWTRTPAQRTLENFRSIPADYLVWSSQRIRKGQPVVISRMAELPPEAATERQLYASLGTLSTVLLPLMVSRVPMGVVAFSCTAQERTWTPDMLKVFQLLADIFASTMDRKRSDEEVRERLRFEELISVVSTRLMEASAQTLPGMVDETLQKVGAALRFDRTLLYLFDDARDRLLFPQQWCAEGVERFGDKVVGRSSQEFGWPLTEVVLGREVLVSRETCPPEAENARRALEVSGLEFVALVPTVSLSGVLGMMSFHSRGKARFSEAVLGRLKIVAELVAGALARTRAESLLERRLRITEAISLVSAGFIDLPSQNMGPAVGEALRTMGEGLELDTAFMGLLSDDRNSLRIQRLWARSPRAGDSPGDVLAVGATPWLTGQLREGRPVIFNTLDELPAEAAADRVVFEQRGVKSAVVMPVTVGGTNVGVLGFSAVAAARRWTHDELAALRLLGEIVANAYGRSKAEDDRQQAFKELEALRARIESERDYLREEIRVDQHFGDIVGSSPALRKALDVVDRVAPTMASVLIRGESGVGKELFARAIHARSARSDGPLVKVNCAAIPKELFESEFFGHVRGSFTGAHKDRTGRFELAHGGSLFLDEVGEIPLDLQAKLLRVLQEGELERVGDDRTRRVDVRVIAATNRNLDADVAAGKFRQDLYYRLSVFPLEVPSLRQRPQDIVPLAEHFLRALARDAQRRDLRLEQGDRDTLLRYPWPGNIRELRHVMERAVILSPGSRLRVDLALPLNVPVPAQPAPSAHLPAEPGPPLTETDLRNLERSNMLRALEMTGWRVAGDGGAAQMLGMRPSTLRDRMKALGLQRSG